MSAPQATDSPSPVSAPATPSASPSPQPTATGKVAVDTRASLSVNPVDYDGKSVVVARFSAPVASRPVSLQRKAGAGWMEVATGSQDKRGRVSFLAPSEAGTFRAVALELTTAGKTRKAVTTPSAGSAQQWRTILSSDFSGSTLPAPWDHRNLANYQAGGRQCSAPYASNVRVRDGKVALSMTKETSAANISRAKAAGCKEGKYFRNAMISTEGRFGVRTGLVAARVKFSEGQGMHGAVWLQSASRSEIDFVESYGYGKGLTSVVHVNEKRYPVKGSDTYVNSTAVKDRAWWKRYHVYSAEWDRNQLVFRIDGTVTQRISRRTPNTSYFLVISQLSSDWELKRLTNPVRRAEGVQQTKLPQSMLVDWVKVWTPT